MVALLAPCGRSDQMYPRPLRDLGSPTRAGLECVGFLLMQAMLAVDTYFRRPNHRAHVELYRFTGTASVASIDTLFQDLYQCFGASRGWRGHGGCMHPPEELGPSDGLPWSNNPGNTLTVAKGWRVQSPLRWRLSPSYWFRCCRPTSSMCPQPSESN